MLGECVPEQKLVYTVSILLGIQPEVAPYDP